MDSKPVVGQDFSLDVFMPTVGDRYNLSNTDWEVEVFVSQEKVARYGKDQATKINDNTYSLPIETSEIGPGRYYSILSVKIPDARFKSGYRLESWQKFTGVIIYPKYDV